MRVFAGGTAGRVDMGAYLALELVLQASQRGGLVRRHGRAAETPRAHRGARQRERHRRERQHSRARSGLMVETGKTARGLAISRFMHPGQLGGFIIYPPVTGTRALPRWRTSRCAMRARSTEKAATLSRDPRSTRTRRSTTRGTTPPGTSKAG